ncbi:MAG: hypothetical protein RL607_2180 [Bacteroidota bacterium]|jgi:tetratricopeptide (TPR) repeat protein
MRKVIVFLFLSLFGFLSAQNSFEAANALYQKGSFSEAANLYERELKAGNESAELHYNLGNCYYKLHRVAPAIFHLEKAHLMDPYDSAIENNLVFARKISADTIPHFPKVGFEKMLVQSTGLFYYETWGYLTLVFAIAMVACFMGYYLTTASVKKRRYFGLMIVNLFLLIIGLFAGFYQRNYRHNQHPAIVFSDQLALHAEPTSRSTVALRLREGAKVFVLEKSGNWMKVQLTDDTLGWLQANGVQEVNP